MIRKSQMCFAASMRLFALLRGSIGAATNDPAEMTGASR